MSAELDVVIVSWNAGEQLADCLASIAEAARGIALGRVVVVDNASTDGSVDDLEARFGDGLPLEVLRNVENAGFGAACNQGAARGDAAHVLFLNPDTRLFAESLSAPLAHLAAPENAGVGACGIQLVDEAGEVSRSCARFPRPDTYLWIALGLDRLARFRARGYRMSEWDHASTRDVDHVMGAFYLIRRAAFDGVGGFDEDYFVYFEDLDLSRRVRAAGWAIRHLAGPRAFHAGGGTTRSIRARRLALFTRGKLRFARKHESFGAFALAAAATLLVEPFARIAGALARGRVKEAACVVGGYARLPFVEPERG